MKRNIERTDIRISEAGNGPKVVVVKSEWTSEGMDGAPCKITFPLFETIEKNGETKIVPTSRALLDASLFMVGFAKAAVAHQLAEDGKHEVSG